MRKPLAHRHPLAPLGLFAATLLVSFVARAQSEPAVCAPAEALDVDALLRRTSLDLRGRIPSAEDYAAMEGRTELPAGLVQDFMQDEGFLRMMRRYHEELLWPNISNVRMHITSNFLRTTNVGGTIEGQLNATGRRRLFRGSTDATCDFTREQTAFDDEATKTPTVTEVDGIRIEGFRWVEPYWAPGTQIKVCAYDAQETETVVVGSETLSCGDARAYGARRVCGCGKNLKFCLTTASQAEILASMREQVLRSVDEVVKGSRPYTSLVTGTTAYQDGKIAFFKRNLGQALNYRLLYNLPEPQEQIRDVPYSDASWAEVDRGGLHAGVVTMPAFLLRFQTQRSRANRFSNAFLCRPFEPPQDLVEESGCSDTGTDLTQRCYCQSCHRRLEPLSMHWAQFAEAGSSQLADRQRLPLNDPSCIGSSSDRCKRFYVTEPDAPTQVRGLLRAFEWSTLHPTYLPAVEQGPAREAAEMLATGEFADCTVRRMFAFFIKRPVDSAGSERALFQKLKSDFIASNYDLPSLVGAIVSLPQYRSAR